MNGRITVEDETRPRLLRLDGEFDIANERELVAAIVEARGSGEVSIDMSAVTFIDTCGLHAILDAARSIETLPAVILLDPPSRVVRTMELVGMVRLPEIEIRSNRDG